MSKHGDPEGGTAGNTRGDAAHERATGGSRDHLNSRDVDDARHASKDHVAQAEAQRTNASNGSLGKASHPGLAERQRMAHGQEESLQIVGRDGNASRNSKLSERDLENFKCVLPQRVGGKWMPEDGCKDLSSFSTDMSAYTAEFFKLNNVNPKSPFANAFRHELGAATMRHYGWPAPAVEGLGLCHEIEGWSFMVAAMVMARTPAATNDQKIIAAKMEKAVGPTWLDSIEDINNNHVGSSIESKDWAELVHKIAESAAKKYPGYGRQ